MELPDYLRRAIEARGLDPEAIAAQAALVDLDEPAPSPPPGQPGRTPTAPLPDEFPFDDPAADAASTGVEDAGPAASTAPTPGGDEGACAHDGWTAGCPACEAEQGVAMERLEPGWLLASLDGDDAPVTTPGEPL